MVGPEDVLGGCSNCGSDAPLTTVHRKSNDVEDFRKRGVVLGDHQRDMAEVYKHASVQICLIYSPGQILCSGRIANDIRAYDIMMAGAVIKLWFR